MRVAPDRRRVPLFDARSTGRPPLIKPCPRSFELSPDHDLTNGPRARRRRSGAGHRPGLGAATIGVIIAVTCGLTSGRLDAVLAASGRSWPGFRGFSAGHTDARQLPTHWSDTSGVAWRASVDGRGQSSPVVDGGTIYVTSVDGPAKETVLLSSFDLATGASRWTRRFTAARRLEDTDTTTKAAPTPVVHRNGVVALFESGNLIAVGHDGAVRWRRSLMDEYGDIRNRHHYGSSPALHGDALLVFVGHAGPSYLLRVDARTGATTWKADRPSVTSWQTPIVGGRPGAEWVGVPTKTGFDAHRLADGSLAWSREGVLPAAMASATLSGTRLIVPSSSKGGSGVLTGEGGAEAVWISEDATVEFSSPLVAGDLTFFVNPVGVLLRRRFSRRPHALETPAARRDLGFSAVRRAACVSFRRRGQDRRAQTDARGTGHRRRERADH